MDVLKATQTVLLEKFIEITTIEQKPSGQQVIEERPTTENISFNAEAFAAKHLWGYVPGCPTDISLVFGLALKDTESEVTYLNIELTPFFYFIDKDVIRLNVSVNDLFLIHKVDSQQKLLHYDLDFIFTENFAPLL